MIYQALGAFTLELGNEKGVVLQFEAGEFLEIGLSLGAPGVEQGALAESTIEAVRAAEAAKAVQPAEVKYARHKAKRFAEEEA